MQQGGHTSAFAARRVPCRCAPTACARHEHPTLTHALARRTAAARRPLPRCAGGASPRGGADPPPLAPPRRALLAAAPRIVGGQTARSPTPRAVPARTHRPLSRSRLPLGAASPQVPATTRAAYSFAVLLRVSFASGTYQCGGTLIAPSVVLTAAHCLAEDPDAYDSGGDTGVRSILALLGWQDVSRFNASAPASAPPATEPLAEAIRASGWEWHAGFDPHASSGVLNAHDIALVFLAAPSAHGVPVALDFPPGLPGSGGTALALGWGLTRALRADDPAAGTLAVKLQRVRLPLARGAACDAQAGANGNAYDDTRQVCGATDGGVDTCYVRSLAFRDAHFAHLRVSPRALTRKRART